MSSINPVILLPGAARRRGAQLGQDYIASVTLGAGQFCTSPGVVLVLEHSQTDAFEQAATAALHDSAAQPMLTGAIQTAYRRGVDQLLSHPGVECLARGRPGAGAQPGQAALLAVTAERFMSEAALRQEVFGPASLLVRARDLQQIGCVIDLLEGQLTTTILFEPEDEPSVAALLPHLQRKAGRIIGNGWPTGVEVCHAMVHGGPYPATTDARYTSVGALALQRFLRPICYQNLPDSLLPAALRSDNPLQLPRRIDGVLHAS
jgi:NADP-dependent aldehyde dehydrogenase